jgi:hypothetical protein
MRTLGRREKGVKKTPYRQIYGESTYLNVRCIGYRVIAIAATAIASGAGNVARKRTASQRIERASSVRAVIRVSPASDVMTLRVTFMRNSSDVRKQIN